MLLLVVVVAIVVAIVVAVVGVTFGRWPDFRQMLVLFRMTTGQWKLLYIQFQVWCTHSFSDSQ